MVTDYIEGFIFAKNFSGLSKFVLVCVAACISGQVH